MNEELFTQIHNSLKLKDTDELLEIWQTNDHVEWSDSAFEAIREILAGRDVELPEQDEPIYEHTEEDEAIEYYRFTEEELKIIDDEDPPVFYDPLDVMFITRRIETAAIAWVVLTTISVLLNVPESLNLTQSLIQDYPPLTSFAVPLTVIATVIAFPIVFISTYLPLKALARILRILMEMEFNSRK